MKHLIKIKEISNITDVDYDRIILTDDGSIHAQGEVNTSNTYNAIDLGLPSGLLWCDRNVGATNITDSGLYFQWGDTQGWTKEQVENDEVNDYKWFDGSRYIKYNNEDRLTTLELEDDAAHVNMGGDWRMPTYEDFKELITSTDITLIYKNGTEASGIVDEYGSISWENVDLSNEEQISMYDRLFYLIQGIRLTGRGEYSNNSIFIPARLNEEFVKINACLYSASNLSSEFYIVYAMFFDSYHCTDSNQETRGACQSIRGVIDKH